VTLTRDSLDVSILLDLLYAVYGIHESRASEIKFARQNNGINHGTGQDKRKLRRHLEVRCSQCVGDCGTGEQHLSDDQVLHSNSASVRLLYIENGQINIVYCTEINILAVTLGIVTSNVELDII
jgi:hypothetical protein